MLSRWSFHCWSMHAQHDDALVMPHRVRPDQLLLGFVALFQLVEDRVAEFLPVQLFRINPFRRDVHPEASEDLVLQALDVPICRARFLAGILVEQAAENIANVILKNQFFLVESFQQLPAQRVNRLALLVHHVVVFEQMFAGLEVLPFDRLLRSPQFAA